MTETRRARPVRRTVADCIDHCLQCHDACTKLISRWGSPEPVGGRQAYIALLDCEVLCRTAQDFMLRNSPLYPGVCRLFADACERCADACEAMDAADEPLRRCIRECRNYADCCRSLLDDEQT